MDAEDQLQVLRRHLLGPEQDRLRRLEKQLADRADEVGRLAEALPGAIVERTKRDEQLGFALRPTIETAIREDVRRKPEFFAEAIYPVIGPAIGRAIRAALAQMVQRLSEALANATSVNGWRWRLEAFRTKRPFAEVVLLRTLVYRVEQVFLVHRDSGLLLEHVTSPDVTTKDPALVSALLTAMNEFAREAFQQREGLDTFTSGDLTVWLEAGSQTFVAAVVRGPPPADLGSMLLDTVQKVQLLVASALDSFTGDVQPFEQTRPLLEDCLRSRQRRPSARRGHLLVGALLALILLPLVGWAASAAHAHRRFDSAVRALREEPGIVVVSARMVDGAYEVTGLRDPLSRAPSEVLAERGLPPERLRARLEPVQSLHPQVLQRRVRRLLSPPDTVSLTLQEGRVVARGHAPRVWIERARDRMAALDSAVGFSSEAVAEDEAIAQVRGLVADVTGMQVHFPSGGAELGVAERKRARGLVTALEHLFALSPRAGFAPEVVVVGHTDSSGSAALNQRLAGQRAEVVRSWLVGSGLPAEAIRAEVAPQREKRRGDLPHPVAFPVGRRRVVILKKICLLGASAVGKTSVVARFIDGTFSDVYRTTIGVRIHRKSVRVEGIPLELVVWDFEGEDEFAQVRPRYLRGAAGYFLVADGTRRHTLDTALRLGREAVAVVGQVPFVLLVNKLDRFEAWEVSDRDVAELKARGSRVERSSAKTGAGISEAFEYLERELLRADRRPPHELLP